MSEHTPADESATPASDDGLEGGATVTCPRCGAEKPAGGYAPAGWVAAPPDSTVLTTVGMASKAAAGGDGERCACGERRLGEAAEG